MVSCKRNCWVFLVDTQPTHTQTTHSYIQTHAYIWDTDTKKRQTKWIYYYYRSDVKYLSRHEELSCVSPSADKLWTL